MIIGPTMIIIFFVVAFILWLKFISFDKPVKVIREEQLYNRYKEQKNNSVIIVDQRKPIKRQEINPKHNIEKETEDSVIGTA
jgi:hypothetical protein